MSTIQIYGERIMRILQKGNVTRERPLDYRDIHFVIRDQAAAIAKGQWFESRNDGGKDISSIYVCTFTVDVLVDAQGVNYCLVPVSSYLNLPDESGVQSVRPDPLTTSTKKTKERELTAFIPVPNRYRDLYSVLPAGAMEGLITYHVRKNKIYFGTLSETFDGSERTVIDVGIKKVEIDVATVSPEAVAIDEPLPIPQDKEKDLMIGVLMFFGLTDQKAKDLLNNSNPNK